MGPARVGGDDGRRGTWRALALLALLGGTADASDLGCATYDRPVATGRVSTALPELSGLAASGRHAGIFWSHNDSGNAFVLYAMRETGAIAAAFPIRGGNASDVEDVAVGPCARNDPAPCVYLADTGDNFHRRTSAQIFRVREPETLAARPLVAARLTFTYADGGHDVEAILVDPRTADVYLITKSLLGLGDLYRLDTTAVGGADARAVRIASLPSGDAFDAATTAASVHPSGERVLVRTYRFVWEFRRPGATSLADVLATKPVSLPTASDGLPEAIAYLRDGRGYLLAGEGAGTTIRRVGCRDATPAATRP